MSTVLRRARPLLAAAHPGPTVAVTTLTALLAVASGLPAPRTLLVTAAVLAGQLSIGWGNDLVDARRDRSVGRRDKPLATGAVTTNEVVTALLLALAACLVPSLAAGWRSAAAHLGCVVVSGHSYNVGLKRTALSWLPYAVAFGALPAVVSYAAEPPAAPPGWMLVVGAALGVAAHLLNVLPDLADDAATDVRGLPHRLGAARSRMAATALLLVASLTAVLGGIGAGAAGWLVLAVVAALAVVALRGSGRAPFRAAVAIAVVDVALLVLAGPPPNSA